MRIERKRTRQFENGSVARSPSLTSGSTASAIKATGRRPVRIPVVCILVVIAMCGLQRRQAAIAGDERNIERYAVRRVEPVYPPLAQKQRIEGIVVVQLSVGGNGKVASAEFIRGNNIFKSVSLEAAKRWEFKVPTGETLEGTIRFTFKIEG